MHDLDRTMFEGETGSSEAESHEFLGVLGELLGEGESYEAFEGEDEAEGEGVAFEGFETLESLEAGELNETQELELASELLEVTNEAELEQFLGKLIGTAFRGAKRFAQSDTGRQLGGVLRQAARKAVPIVGRAVGDWVTPGGGAKGAQLASAAAKIFGLELEGLSHEDREFEVARSFVRFGRTAAQAAAQAAPRVDDPSVAVQRAVEVAARRHAPGLVPVGRGFRGRRGRSGRWVRRGRTIVLYGA